MSAVKRHQASQLKNPFKCAWPVLGSWWEKCKNRMSHRLWVTDKVDIWVVAWQLSLNLRLAFKFVDVLGARET